MTTTASSDPLAESLMQLRLYGCLARIDEIREEPWLERVMAIEREERTRRSLVHRNHLAGVGAFKPLCDFDWAWPKSIDRAQVEDLFSLRFIAEGENVVVLGPNGVGKTMLLRNLAHRALHDGRAVVVRTASDLLADLAKQESSVARARRLEAYVRPHLLCVDEVGYLSYDVRHADLLFEVVTRRHEKKRSIVLTTNKAFAEWPTTFPNAACVVALVDRLINRADVVVIDGDSYRLREAEERQRAKASARKRGKEKPTT
jgi:DNA replication protein DnaC